MDIKRSRQLLSLTIIFFWASEYCHAPYFTPYLQSMGFAAEIIGILTGTYGFTQMLVRIPLGIVTDTTGCYKKTILMGTMFTTASSFWLMFATDFVSIFICRVLAGVAASSWLAFTILYAAYYQADESVQGVTNANALNSAGKLLAFVLGLTTASLWGYKIPLLCRGTFIFRTTKERAHRARSFCILLPYCFTCSQSQRHLVTPTATPNSRLSCKQDKEREHFRGERTRRTQPGEHRRGDARIARCPVTEHPY